MSEVRTYEMLIDGAWVAAGDGAVAVDRGPVGHHRVDETGAELAVERVLFALAGGERHARAEPVDGGEERPARPRPEIDMAAEIAHRCRAFGQRGFLPRLAPEARHDLRIAQKLGAGRGERRPGFLPVQKDLAEFLLKPAQPRRHCGLRDVELFRGANE